MYDVQIHPEWKAVLKEEFEKSYFQSLCNFLKKEKQEGRLVYPPGRLMFNAFNTTPFSKVKVVILGQDPYHGFNQAHGLCFSVPDGIAIPPSLRNIYIELADDLGIPPCKHGNLTRWAEQGVFLLNAILTVRANAPASHQKMGWEIFTDAVIAKLNDQRQHLVFILWGKYAQGKKPLINTRKHLVLEAPHPSPYSAMTGFFGSRPFSAANAYLASHGIEPIGWQL